MPTATQSQAVGATVGNKADYVTGKTKVLQQQRPNGQLLQRNQQQRTQQQRTQLQQQIQKQQSRRMPESKPGYLDLLFIHDATGSQTPYIQETSHRCREIVELVKRSGKLHEGDGLRTGLIAYRDHPPPGESDDEPVCLDYDKLSDDTDKMLKNVESLEAYGGDDGPEALADALHGALSLNWRPDATKVVVLVTDAPPHGIGEEYDNYPDQCLCGHDPLELARKMAKQGITILVVACEPGLSDWYLYAKDFYTALANITGGVLFALTDVSVLSTFIIGSCLEAVDLDSLTRKLEKEIAESIRQRKPKNEIVREVLHKLKGLGQKVMSVTFGNSPYVGDQRSAHNVGVFMKALDIASARPNLRQLPEGATWFTPFYNRVKSRSPSQSADAPEVEVTFRNLTDDNEVIEVILGEDIGKQNPRTWAVQPGFLVPCKFSMNKTYNFVVRCGRFSKTFARCFSKPQQDLDVFKFFA